MKILNSYGDLVDDYETALAWAKAAPWKDKLCSQCGKEGYQRFSEAGVLCKDCTDDKLDEMRFKDDI
jgi:hypothetical protein